MKVRFRWKGIEEQREKNLTNWEKFIYFHSAPVVKMSYHFVSHQC